MTDQTEDPKPRKLLACDGQTYPVKDWTWKLENKGQSHYVDPVAMARMLLTPEAFDEWLERATPEQKRPRWMQEKGPTEASLILWLEPLRDEQTRTLNDSFAANRPMRFYGDWWPEEIEMVAASIDWDPQGPRYDVAEPGVRVRSLGTVPDSMWTRRVATP